MNEDLDIVKELVKASQMLLNDSSPACDEIKCIWYRESQFHNGEITRHVIDYETEDMQKDTYVNIVIEHYRFVNKP
jgi:hypothetical protein